MNKANTRWIFFFDKILQPTPIDSPIFDLNKILKKIKKQVNTDGVVKLINNETAAIRIRQINIDEDQETATLLIQYADKNISDPVFSDLETGTLRIEEKLEGEGVAVSAHMVISLRPRANDKTAYIALLEQTPGLGKSRITPFLTSEYKKLDDHFKDEDEKVRRCWPNVEMTGHVSESLRKALETGTLQEIELVQRNEVKEFDLPTTIKQISRNLILKPSKPYTGEKACGIIETVREAAKKSNYDIVKVRYKKKAGKQRTEELDSKKEDAIDTLCTRIEQLGLTEPLKQCEEEISEELEKYMKQFLNNERKKEEGK